MRVLVATSRTQGWRSSDYHCCTEGELVWIGLVCPKDRRDPDGGCGCGRGFSGMHSHRATSTAVVVDRPMSRDDFVLALADSLAQQGWEFRFADAIADELLNLAAYFPVGTVVERRLDDICARPVTEPAGGGE